MKRLILAALLSALAFSPSLAGTTDKSGTVTTGGAAQNAIASNYLRKGWCIQNPGTATLQGISTAESLFVRVDGTASTTTGIELAPGQEACSAPNQTDATAISVYGATTAHAWKGFEIQ